MIYVKLRGRLGNQLFLYGIAYRMSLLRGDDIILDETEVVKVGWENSIGRLLDVSSLPPGDTMEQHFSPCQRLLNDYCWHNKSRMNSMEAHAFERKHAALFQKKGLLIAENGYLPIDEQAIRKPKNLFLEGYFQAIEYMETVLPDLRKLLGITNNANSGTYGDARICLTLRLESDYSNNPDLSVCTVDYYRKAIEYVESHFPHPIYFVCADNLDLAREFFPEIFEREVILQDKTEGSAATLRHMASCDGFILTNSSYAWWGQALSMKEDKLVVAPSKWYNYEDSWQYDLYDPSWVRIEV